jgi:formamidopyrimidine-DNA glycosylase
MFILNMGGREMIEIPEADVISEQLNKELTGKTIVSAVAGAHPHKFAWYTGEPGDYGKGLEGKTVVGAYPEAGRVFIEIEGGMALIFGEGTRISFLEPGVKRPDKHQLLVEFNDGYGFSVSIQMYGFILLEEIASITNQYVRSSMDAPSPLDDEFDEEYFMNLFNANKYTNLSSKAFLATDQRIPGLGNGVLQDILFNALIHPRLKLKDFNDEEPYNLFNSIKITLKEMTDMGGRSTEKDIYGNKGGYAAVMSGKTAGTECPSCGALIEKENYMGGSVYFCPECQRKE